MEERKLREFEGEYGREEGIDGKREIDGGIEEKRKRGRDRRNCGLIESHTINYNQLLPPCELIHHT